MKASADVDPDSTSCSVYLGSVSCYVMEQKSISNAKVDSCKAKAPLDN